MDLPTILWLIGFAVTNGAVIVGIYVKLISRIVAIETLLRTMNGKMARALHSPDDHHGLDPLLDKFLDNNGELSHEEWRKVHNECEEILKSEVETKGLKALAAWVSSFAEQELGKRSL